MHLFEHLRRAILPCILSLIPLTALADPPQLTEPPLVQGLTGPLVAELLASERGLTITVDDLADLAPAYDDGTGSVLIVLNDGTAGTVTSPQIPVRYGPDGGSYSLPDTLGQPSSLFTNSFGYRLTRTAETVDVSADGGVVVSARIGALGAVLATATAPTFAAAQALLLANPALDGIRNTIAAMQAVLAAPTMATTEAVTSVLSGRDTYRTTLITFGPDSDFIYAGNLGECATPLTACEGGTAVEIADGATHFNEITLQDLYITDTLTRTATTVQNWFLDLTLNEGTDPPQLTGPNGPPVQVGIGTQDSSLFASERGLAIPVGDLAALVPAFNDGTGERILEGVSYAPDGGTEVLVRTGDEGLTQIFIRDSFGYRVFRADRTVDVDVDVDGGVTVQARIGSAGAVLASAAGMTLDAARTLLLADAALDGIRNLILSAELVATAPTVTTTEATTTLLTGRDTYFTQVVTFGPDTAMVGNLGECATPVTDCEGGTTVELPVDTLLLSETLLQDLYITDTLTRTATTVQNWFLNLTLADPLDPPQLTEGPLVQLGGAPVESDLLVSERGLAIPVDDLADLAPVYRIGDVETRITLNDGSGGILGTGFPARYAADGGAYELVPTGGAGALDSPEPPIGVAVEPGSDLSYFANAFGYRLFRADRTVDVAVDGGVTVQARIGRAGAVLASAAGATVEAVRELLLADTALDSIRSLIVAAELVQVASTVTMAEATTSILTGRDTYQVTAITFGPTGGIMVGNLGECATPLTNCEGGTEVTIGTGATHFNTVTLQDLYITDTLTRTATTVQNWFLNLTLAESAPLQVGAAGPVVVGNFGQPLDTEVMSSERGLDLALEDIDYLAPGFVPETIDVSSLEESVGALLGTGSFGYQIFRTEAVTETAVDGGFSIDVRVGPGGPVLATGTGATAEAAREAALASSALDGIRGLIVAMQEAALAATETVVETVTSVITGRDRFNSEVDLVFGPAADLRIGYLGECASAFDDCSEDGQLVTLGVGDTLALVRHLEHLYITDRVAQMVTTVRNGLLTLTLADPLDTPQLTEGPLVQTGSRSLESELIVSERGLAIPVDDLADLAPVYNPGTGDVAIFTTVDDVQRPASYAADSGFIQMEEVDGGNGSVNNAFNAFAYRVFRGDRTVDVAVDGGDGVAARIGNTGPVLARATGPTLEAAQAAVLADAALDGIRADIVRVEAVAAAPTVTVQETETSLLTGRDTYMTTVITFGPEVVLAGNLGQCATAITDCAGGVEVGLANSVTNFSTLWVQDLYITDTLTRTVTTVQNWFLNIFLAGADGTPHVGAQGVGLAGGEGFLKRLLAEGRKGGQPAALTRSTKGAGPKGDGPRAFAAFAANSGAFDSFGLAAKSDWHSSAFTGGFAYAVSPEWTAGLAIETGPWSWAGGGARAKGDSHKLGLFATYENGPLTFGLSGFVGQQKVEAVDALGATAQYKVHTRGLATKLGYAIQQGDWTLTPSVGVSWLHWAAPQVTDSAGNQIGAARISQIRPELGLSAQRSFATAQGVVDLNLDARVWTVTGDRTAVSSLGVLTQGPQVGKHGGSIGIGASWQINPNSVLSARVEHSFSGSSHATEGSLGLKIRF